MIIHLGVGLHIETTAPDQTDASIVSADLSPFNLSATNSKKEKNI